MLIVILLAVCLVILAGLGVVLLRRRRRERQIEQLHSSVAAFHGLTERLRREAGALHAAVSVLPEHDDLLVRQARTSSLRASSAVEAVDRLARQLIGEHTTVVPDGTEQPEPDTEQLAAATLAYADARVRAAEAAQDLAAATEAITAFRHATETLPARLDAAHSGVEQLSHTLGELSETGYRTSDFDHVPPALLERLDGARVLLGERRPAAVGEVVTGVERDLDETRQRLLRLDREREQIIGQISEIGGRTSSLDGDLAAAHRDLDELGSRTAPTVTDGLRHRLKEAARARSALPRLLRSATEESSIQRHQLTRARGHLDEASQVYDLARGAVTDVQARLRELTQLADELPVSADRTAVRAQRLAERATRQSHALHGGDLDAHTLGDRARDLGDQARADRPDLVRIADLLDELRHDVADAERGLDEAVAAYAARRLAISSAGAAVDLVTQAAARPGESATEAARLRASALLATELLSQAETEQDHERARDLAEAAKQAARGTVE